MRALTCRELLDVWERSETASAAQRAIGLLAASLDQPSEAVEFVCPRAALKKFVNAEITNQQLLDESIVLVNGVRIALNLQLVE